MCINTLAETKNDSVITMGCMRLVKTNTKKKKQKQTQNDDNRKAQDKLLEVASPPVENVYDCLGQGTARSSA